jgi:26S proteasome regulatory subunit N2
MFEHCLSHGQYRKALGIALETRRLDVFKRAVAFGDQTDTEICDMLSYAFMVVMSLIRQKRDYRCELLRTLVDLYRSLAKPDYVQVNFLVFLILVSRSLVLF